MKLLRTLLCLTLTAATVLGVFCFATSARSFVLGDADTDRVVSVIDATTIQKVRASISVEAFDPVAADVDGDDVVSVLDATYVQKSLAHVKIEYAVGAEVEIDELATEPSVETVSEPTKPSSEVTEPETQAPTFHQGENELPFIPAR